MSIPNHHRYRVLFCILSSFFTFPLFSADIQYADPQSCAECHSEACEHWIKSDHAKSMDHATEQSVHGDFNNAAFLHIGFDDILLLSHDEIKILLHEPGTLFTDFVTATFNAKSGLLEKLRLNLTDAERNEFDAELEYQKSLRFHRPGDIAAAQDRIVQTIRQQITSGSITTKVGTSFRMYRREKKYMIDTDLGSYEIQYTLGTRPLQQYLVETDGGRIQTLPIAWDTNGKRWFHLYPKEQILKNDPLHWSKSLQNWNKMCADCHTTNLHKNFDPKTKEYKTTYSEINVGCQSCHGPCGKHVEAAQKARTLSTPLAVQVPSLTTLNSVDSCAFCHARRRLLREGPKPPEVPAADWFVPESVDANIYYPDGQLLEEAFEYGSFLQSKMHSKGVGCTNCHEPHSLQLKFQGNRLCLQCHSPSIYNTVKHHFHPNADKPGTKCVECHFPKSMYMVVDPRYDHSIRKPSPALTLAAGVPNACSLCHRDRKKGETLEWARDKIDSWYAAKRKTSVGYSDLWPTEKHYALAISAGRRDDPAAVQKLLDVVNDKRNREFRPVIRASAITLLSRTQTEQSASDVFAACLDGLTDTDPRVRFASVNALSQQTDDVKLKHLTPLLNDPTLAVRTETARVLASVQEAGALVPALNEYIESQKINSDQPAAYLNLAVLEHDLASKQINDVTRWLNATIQDLPPQDPAVADAKKTALPLIERLTNKPLEFYRQSLEIDGDFLPSRINLAMLYHDRGNDTAAEKEFREALRIEPANGNTAYSLGLLLAELGRSEESIVMLRQASKNMEHSATRNRVRYNLGLSLLRQKCWDEAEKELAAVVQSEPKNIAFVYALMVLYLQQGEKQKAAVWMKKLNELDPQKSMLRTR
jgi:predicted CXXCH cytochrome family protein